MIAIDSTIVASPSWIAGMNPAGLMARNSGSFSTPASRSTGRSRYGSPISSSSHTTRKPRPSPNTVITSETLRKYEVVLHWRSTASAPAAEESPMIALTVNGEERQIDAADPAMPLLLVLRDHLDLVGAKFGCGIGQCGACTVLVDGEARRSCSTPVSSVAGRSVTTIEGLAKDGILHPLQEAWISEDVA